MNLGKLRKIGKQRPIIIIGPTAAGKDTLIRQLGIKKLTTTTTRPMRDGEVNGIDYWFVDDEEFDRVAVAAVRTYNTAFGEWRYGLDQYEIAKSGIVVLDLAGAVEFYNYRAENGMTPPHILYLHVEKEDARQRQMKRGDYDKTEFERRWSVDADWLALARLFADEEMEI